MNGFRPLRRADGYLPIEDHGLIGDGMTAALVGRDGCVSWLCLPRFDSPPLFCGLLDAAQGGGFSIAPEDVQESRQYYRRDTGILITEMRGPSGTVRITDALVFRSGADLREDTRASRGELLRSVDVLQGEIRLRVHLDPRGGASAEHRSGGLSIRSSMRPDLHLRLVSTQDIQGLDSTLPLREGAQAHFLLSWEEGSFHDRADSLEPERLLSATENAWLRWAESLDYQGPQQEMVRRSALVLKMLDHFSNGAMVAAPTSSLPEAIGGVRNWDYRYVWIRDAAFSVYAFQRVGLRREARHFLAWVLDTITRDGRMRPRVLYNMDWELPPPERTDEGLEGYRGSYPVRWGNAAADQVQRDVFGELLDCAYQWGRTQGDIGPDLWERLRHLAETARREWRLPDHGIWEVRAPGRPFTYSIALCHVALDRAARLAEQLNLRGDIAGWRTEAQKIRQAILDEGWNAERHTLTQSLGGSAVDASLLALPLRRVLPADHPKMVATTSAVAQRLGAGHGLLYRYLTDEASDGLPGDEGAFLICSFWLVDNLALQGRVDEAVRLYESLCGRANDLGLLPEEIDPTTGAFLGNFPQAISHVGVVSSGVNLARVIERQQRTDGELK